MKHFITYSELNAAALRVADQISEYCPHTGPVLAFAIPRGGVAAALAVRAYCPRLQLVQTPEEAHIFIDDLLDSGATMERYCDEHPSKPFFVLFTKQPGWVSSGADADPAQWLVFPWEAAQEDTSAHDIVVRLLQFIGEDPEREGLLETPARVVKAWEHWFGGYKKDPAKILKVFADGAERHDQMVTVKDIPFFSHCEHHIAPIFGTVTVSYIPNGKIVGLSKLSRLVDMYARRLQVQERLTDQIADALHQHLEPLGVGVTITARHLCMESRGVSQQGHSTVTTALRGVIKDDPQARAEFLKFCI